MKSSVKEVVNSESRIGNALKILLISVFAAFSSMIIVLTVRNIWGLSAWQYILTLFFVGLIVYVAVGKINLSGRRFAIGLFGLSLMINILLIFNTHTKPVSDFAVLYDAATKMVQGDFSWNQSDYFSKLWPYQSGVVCLYAAIMKVFGTSIVPLQIFNGVFVAGTKLLVYLIAREMAAEKHARFAALMYLLYPAPYFIATTLSNQQFATCLFYLAIYVLIRAHQSLVSPGRRVTGRHIGLSLAAGLSIAIANAVRPEGSVLLLAIVAASVLASICMKKWDYLRSAALTVLSYLLVFNLISALIVSNGVNANGLKNMFPSWKFVVGFNQQTRGQFSPDDASLLNSIEDVKQRDELAKKLILERLPRKPVAIGSLLIHKTNIMWAQFDSPYWMTGRAGTIDFVSPENLTEFIKRVSGFERAQYLLISTLALFSLGSYFRRNKSQGQDSSVRDYYGLSIVMSLVTLFYLVFVLIEIQARYRYFPAIAIFILAAVGLDGLSGLSRMGVNVIKSATKEAR